jgi:hypothetical protein
VTPKSPGHFSLTRQIITTIPNGSWWDFFLQDYLILPVFKLDCAGFIPKPQRLALTNIKYEDSPIWHDIPFYPSPLHLLNFFCAICFDSF